MPNLRQPSSSQSDPNTELLELKNRFSVAIKAAKLGIHDYNIIANSVNWDECIREIWGVDANDPITYETFISGVHPNDRQAVQAEMDKALNPKIGEFHFEYRVINRKDNSVRWVYATGKTFFADNRPIRLIGTAEDITERKSVEEALRISEEKFSKAFNSSPAAISISRLSDGLIMDVNGAYYEVFGYTRQEAVGHTSTELGIFTETEGRSRLVHFLHKNGKIRNLPTKFKSKTGQVSDTLVSMDVIKIANEDCIITTVLNITEHKKAEEALEQSKDRLQNILNGIDDGIALVSLDGKVLDINQASMKLLGLTYEEFVGTNVYDIIVEEDRQRAINGAFEVLKTGKVVNEVRVKRKDKPCFWAEISVTALCDKNDQPVLFLGVTRDVTERKKVEEALREAEEQFRGLVESTTDIIWQVDEKAVYTYVSPKVKDVLGYEPEYIVGKTPFDLIDEEDEEKILSAFLEIANKKEPFYGLENWNIHKDGSRVLLETSGVPILDEKGQLLGYRGIDRDITERKKLQQKLENYTKDLEKIVEQRTKQLKEKERLAAIGQTAGMVGHDIRNPLQAITGDVYLLKDYLAEMPDAKSIKVDIAESLDNIDKNIGYINKIVADLQDYAKQLKPEYSEFNVYELVTTVFAPIGIPENITISLDLESTCRLKSDPTLIRRIINNLIVNAIQAMPNGGKLCVNSYQDEKRFFILVEDTGVGIPNEVKPKLFTPMMTTKAKGQGLGLAVVKRLVEALNGTISFESEVGKGTKFIVELPITQR